MGYKLSDIYLFSDFDGTLHSATEGIPQRNLDALQRFVQKGGHFGLATGPGTFLCKGVPASAADQFALSVCQWRRCV